MFYPTKVLSRSCLLFEVVSLILQYFEMETSVLQINSNRLMYVFPKYVLVAVQWQDPYNETMNEQVK